MEKHRCKLCLRKFANGRALGGHMRSHMMNLYATQKKQEQQQHKAKDDQRQLSTLEFEVAKSSISSSDQQQEEEGEEEEEEKSKGRVDAECCFAVEAGTVVLEDGERESETESLKNQHKCRRSKRIRTKSRISNTNQSCVDQRTKEALGCEIHKCAEKGKPDYDSPVSSVSDTTPEEDVAYCLMMLSRDKWMKLEKHQEDDNHSEDVGVVKVIKTRCRGDEYRCETCNKVFRSYQALGGHRASHKKVKVDNETATQETSQVVMETENGAATASVNVDKQFSRMIDLNLPPPLDNHDDDDEISHMELSAVSDSECANPIRQ